MKKKVVLLLILFFTIFFIPSPMVKADGEIGKVKDLFTDNSLKSEIKLILNKGEEDYITSDEAAGITSLLLKDKSIENIKGIEIFSNLKYLNLEENRITTLPAEIGTLKQLQFLYLGGNIITELPKEIGGLILLEELSLRANKLTTLSEELGKLVNLRKIDISSNSLEKLPAGLKGCNKLEVLLADNNILADLPEELGGLKKLLILDLRSNKLISLSPLYKDLDSLFYLDLAENNIYNIDEGAYKKILGIPGHYDLTEQKAIIKLANKGLVGEDYVIKALDICRLNLGSGLEYYLISPDGQRERIELEIKDNYLTVAGDYLTKEGSYVMEIQVSDNQPDAFSGSVYQQIFMIDKVTILPAYNTNQYLIASLGIFVAGLLLIVVVRLVRKGK